MPRAIVRALGVLKRAGADVNARAGLLGPRASPAMIVAAADEVADGPLDDHFPLRVWQTGSGTQTNMNANEVIADRANELAGRRARRKQPVHPNDHVNMSPVVQRHVPDRDAHRRRDRPRRGPAAVACARLRDALDAKRAGVRGRSSRSAARTSRTPCRSRSARSSAGYVAQLDADLERIEAVAPRACYELALGGTAVGTGLNAHPGVRRARGRDGSPSSPACRS